MTKTRNKSFVQQVIIRDLGLCRCCGFKASQVHHVIPLIFGGEDNPTNMIALCDRCHAHAPDNKKDFYEYMKIGGDKTLTHLGVISQQAMITEQKSGGGISFQFAFNLGKRIIGYLREVDRTNSLEEYRLIDSYQIPDVDFNEIITKNQSNCDNKQEEAISK